LHLRFLVYPLIAVFTSPSTVVVGIAYWCGYPECSFASAQIPVSISPEVMGFKLSYPQGRWMDVTTDIGMAIDYFMDFDGITT
jgi:hypothetical protein